MLEGEAQSGTKVVMVGLECRAPCRLIGGGWTRGGSPNEAKVVLHMRAPDAFRFGIGVKELASVLADRLEHAEAHAVGAHEALVDERAESVEISAAHVLHRLERAAPDKDGEASEQRLLVLVEELDAPIDRVAQRSMT